MATKKKVTKQKKPVLKMSWDAAIQKVEAFLNRKLREWEDAHEVPAGAQITLYAWSAAENIDDGAAHRNGKALQNLIGARVAEISSFTRTATGGYGSSYMQVDLPYGAAACLCAERLIIAYAMGWPDDEVEEEEERLDYMMFRLEAHESKRPKGEEKNVPNKN